jgi:hypothetical protein
MTEAELAGAQTSPDPTADHGAGLTRPTRLTPSWA